MDVSNRRASSAVTGLVGGEEVRHITMGKGIRRRAVNAGLDTLVFRVEISDIALALLLRA